MAKSALALEITQPKDALGDLYPLSVAQSSDVSDDDVRMRLTIVVFGTSSFKLERVA